jgi:uncharacterized protein (TIGR03435 family)
MADLSDMDLVRAFARDHSETAFAELVQRHLNLVYSVALRFTGQAGDAQDIAQAVFIILARKAPGLRAGTVLTGWLYETTRFTAARWQRTAARRHAREQEAYMQSLEPDSPDAWQQLAPHLETAMAQLAERDRTLLALRFYQNKTGPEAAALLGLGAAAAQKRTARALEKLRKFLGQRGIPLSAAAIAGAVSANSVQAAPTALAKTITAAATQGAAAGTSTLSLVKGALKIMAWTKIKTAIVAGTVVLLAAGTTTVTVREIQAHETYSWQRREIYGNLLDEVPPQVRIVRTKYGKFGECNRGTDKVLGAGMPVKYILAAAYDTAPAHVVLPASAPAGKYDFIANLPNGNAEALQREIRRKFGLTGRVQVLETNAYLLKVNNAAKLASHAFHGGSGNFARPTGLQYGADALSAVAGGMEFIFDKPIVDQTETAGMFHLQFLADETNWDNTESRIESVRDTLRDELDQAGLELVPTNMPIEMLVVEHAK